ncbi:MAG: hypothetical protein H6748_05855 [Spirochaetaceae bacterium]|nr:hypothetical protein [Myxococcales bacterium]MCB9723550.1 hypothetical protein [Spirochaetaceae bacterium]HPG26058.1 hypothetical protein [Myxococcota bacterium]
MLEALLLAALVFVLHRRFAADYPPAPIGLATLHRGEAAFVQSVAEVLFPGGAGLPVAGADAKLPHYLDRHLSALPRRQRLQIRALLLVFEHLTLFVPGDAPGGRRRFSSLSAPSRVAMLERVAEHPLSFVRTLFMALRAVLVLGYLGHPANLCQLGVAPFEIEPATSDAELLFPRVGGLPGSIRYEASDFAAPAGAPGAATRVHPPLDPHGPRHRAYLRAGRDVR